MLDAFIIEELRRREERERNRANEIRPMMDLPDEDRDALPPKPRDEEEISRRGVVVIDL